MDGLAAGLFGELMLTLQLADGMARREPRIRLYNPVSVRRSPTLNAGFYRPDIQTILIQFASKIWIPTK